MQLTTRLPGLAPPLSSRSVVVNPALITRIAIAARALTTLSWSFLLAPTSTAAIPPQVALPFVLFIAPSFFALGPSRCPERSCTRIFGACLRSSVLPLRWSWLSRPLAKRGVRDKFRRCSFATLCVVDRVPGSVIVGLLFYCASLLMLTS